MCIRDSIYTERNGIYIIDLQKTVKKLEEAYNFVRSLGESGQTLLFVGTKKQAQEAIKEEATRCGGYYVNARWLGGCLLYTSPIRSTRGISPSCSPAAAGRCPSTTPAGSGRNRCWAGRW